MTGVTPKVAARREAHEAERRAARGEWAQPRRPLWDRNVAPDAPPATLTPEELASGHLFGVTEYVPSNPDDKYPDPRADGCARVSWNELVERYRTPHRLLGAYINERGEAC